MPDTLLIVSGGREALPGIRIAKEMGLHVIVSDISPKAPGFSLADDTLLASTYDVEESVSAANRYHRSKRPINGVMCIASDVPLTVANIANVLDLPGISVEAAALASDKIAMKRKFAGDGVPVPWFMQVESPGHLRKLIYEHDYPLVLKPADSRGARGVLRLSVDVDPEWAFREAVKYSPTGRVMIERFLSGPQVSTESMILDGVAYTPGFSDRNYEYMEKYAPYIIENGGDLPSFLPNGLQENIRKLVQRAAKSMGVVNGVVKGDIVVHKGVPHVIELAARLSGGYFCSHLIPLNTGVDFIKQAIRLALGEKPQSSELVPRFKKSVCQRYIFPHEGQISSISGFEEVSTRPEIAFAEITVSRGDIIGAIDSHPARVGNVIAVGGNRQETISNAKAAVNDIKIMTMPSEL